MSTSRPAAWLFNQLRLEPINAKSLKRSLIRSARFALGCYIVLIAYLYNNQQELIFPGSAFKTHVEMSSVHGVGAVLDKIPTPSDSSVRPYILFFYGNGGSLSSSIILLGFARGM